MPDLQALMTRAVGTLYGIAGTVALAGTYQHLAPGTYDAATRVYTPATPTSIPVSVVLLRYTAQEMQPDTVLQTDRKGYVRQAELGIVPAVEDTVLLRGISWRIVAITQDTSRAVWCFQLRREGV